MPADEHFEINQLIRTVEPTIKVPLIDGEVGDLGRKQIEKALDLEYKLPNYFF